MFVLSVFMETIVEFLFSSLLLLLPGYFCARFFVSKTFAASVIFSVIFRNHFSVVDRVSDSNCWHSYCVMLVTGTSMESIFFDSKMLG